MWQNFTNDCLIEIKIPPPVLIEDIYFKTYTGPTFEGGVIIPKVNIVIMVMAGDRRSRGREQRDQIGQFCAWFVWTHFLEKVVQILNKFVGYFKLFYFFSKN